jgi:excisionase family DNA binding protein
MKHSSKKRTELSAPVPLENAATPSATDAPKILAVEPVEANVTSTETDSNASQVLPDVLTVLEVAALLRCERKTVYEAIRRRGLPHQKISARALRFSREAVLEWLRSGQVSRKGRTSNGRT